MKKFLLLIVSILLLSACRTTQRVEFVPVVRDSIQVRTVTRVDSVWRDRVRTEYVKGDTVRILDSVTVQSFQFRERADTLTIRDSIPVIKEIPGPVEYRRTEYDKACARGFWLYVLLTVLIVAWRFVKRYYLRM